MTVDDFLSLILRSRLYGVPQLQQLVQRAPIEAGASPAALAAWLISDHALTPFQVQRLLKGNWRGLVLHKYEMRQLLGKGGMGTVFLALDREENRECALKVLPVSKRAKRRNVRRFRREMQVSQRLQHADIAVAYEAGIWKGIHYLAMEYVPGPTLYQLIRRSGPTSAYWAAKWMSEVAGALDYAHQSGVVHRDLKASNIIITPENRAKLLDLGLARWYDDDHNEDRVLGTRRIVGSFDYIAPEQANNSARADARSDIYGLGCLLYFALTGRPPFYHVEDTREKIRHHCEVPPQPVTELRPGLPPAFAAVIEKMMAKSAEDRYQVAAQVRDELSQWVQRWHEQKLVQPLAPLRSDDELPSTDEPIMIDQQSETGSEFALTQEQASPALFVEEERGFWGRVTDELMRLFRRP